jgi:hypothetical protein
MSGFVQLRKAAISVNSHEQFTRHTFDEVIMTSPISFELAIDANNALLTQSGYLVFACAEICRFGREGGKERRAERLFLPIQSKGKGVMSRELLTA